MNMNDNVSLHTFPDNKSEALTMLYLQNQDLSNMTPKDIFDKYVETLDLMKKYNKDYRKQNHSKDNWAY